MNENCTFKQNVCKTIIFQAKIYKDVFVDHQYLICSNKFTQHEYYILDGNKDNYLHLVGVHTSLSPKTFFEKAFNGTLVEEDFDFHKNGQSEKSVKGSVRRKIIALQDIENFFGKDLYVEEGFHKNRISCAIATSDNKITIGFSEGLYSRPKTLLKGNMLGLNYYHIDLVLSKKSNEDKFTKIENGDFAILNYFSSSISELISDKIIY